MVNAESPYSRVSQLLPPEAIIAINFMYVLPQQIQSALFPSVHK